MSSRLFNWPPSLCSSIAEIGDSRISRPVIFSCLLAMALSAGACCNDGNLPDNIANLHSSIAKERNDAALALARCGSKAGDAVPTLGSLLYDENVGVQSAASYALRKIDTAEAREILKEATERRKRR